MGIGTPLPDRTNTRLWKEVTMSLQDGCGNDRDWAQEKIDKVYWSIILVEVLATLIGGLSILEII